MGNARNGPITAHMALCIELGNCVNLGFLCVAWRIEHKKESVDPYSSFKVNGLFDVSMYVEHEKNQIDMITA